MSMIIRRPSVRVTIDGIPIELTANQGVLSARCSFGYDMETAEATIVVPRKPVWAVPWSRVNVEMGASLATRRLRFSGYLMQLDNLLYPRQFTLICKGLLARTQMRQAALDDESGETYISMCNEGLGETDENQVANILNMSGLTDDVATKSISGTGLLLGTYANEEYAWRDAESAMAYINRLDEVCLGYRTFDSIGGAILRKQIVRSPSEWPVAVFTEGVDVLMATQSDLITEIRNRVRVTGFSDGVSSIYTTVEQPSSYLPSGEYLTHNFSSGMIEKEMATDMGDGLACDQVATWLLLEKNRRLLKMTLTTHRDDVIAPGSTIYLVTGIRWLCDALVWVQHVEVSIDESGQFTQTLTCITGVEESGPIIPVLTDPYADFSFSILEGERVIVDGVATSLFTVQCTQACTPLVAPIVSYAWTASAGGVPATGTGEKFVVSFPTPTGATVTLVCTDNLGHTGTITKPVPTGVGSEGGTRSLYLAGSVDIEAQVTGGWNIFATTGSTVVGNGPRWNAGVRLYQSTDDLDSSPTYSSPFGAVGVTAVYNSLVTPLDVLVGSADGRLAISHDGGATWVIDPATSWGDSNPVIRCVIDASSSSKWWALTKLRLYQTNNAGGNWTFVVSAAVGEEFVDFAIGTTRQMIGMIGGRILCDGAGVAQTFPGVMTDVYGVTADPSLDKFYCYDSAKNTYAHTADAGTELEAKEPLPAGVVVQRRGLNSDPDLDGLLYIAGGTGGAWKSLDAFATAGGYMLIRQPNVDGAPALADYKQVGVGSLNASLTGSLKRVLIARDGRFFWTENIWANSPVWEENSVGLPGGAVYLTQLAIDPFVYTKCYAVGSDYNLYVNTAWRTGGAWTTLLTGAQALALIGGDGNAKIKSIAVTVDISGFLAIAVNHQPAGWPVDQHAYVFISTNSGTSWTVHAISMGGMQRAITTPIVIGQHDRNHMFCCVTGIDDVANIWSSQDMGVNWAIGVSPGTIGPFPPHIPYNGNPLDHECIFPGAASSSNPKRSLDGGVTWSSFATMAAGQFECQGDNADKMISTSGQYSADHGATWASMDLRGGESAVQVSAPKEGYYYVLQRAGAGGANAIRVSRSWAPFAWGDRAQTLPGSTDPSCFTIDPGS